MKKHVIILFIAVISSLAFADDTISALPVDFINICGDIYMEFNKNDGPNSNIVNERINKTYQLALDVGSGNVALYFFLMSYFLHPRSEMNLAMEDVNEMLTLANERYHTSAPPLLYLFLGECLIRSSAYDNALNTFKILKATHLMDAGDSESLAPNMRMAYAKDPPRMAEYYIALLTDEINKTQKNMAAFKKTHPTFYRLN
jgi:hypothetical protein